MGLFDRLRRSKGEPIGEPSASFPPPVVRPVSPTPGPTIPRGGAVKVVGESYRQDALTQITGGHRPHGVDIACIASLIPEPSNEVDREAVMVTVNGLHVGYLNREDARLHRPLIDRALSTARVATVEGCIRGGWDRGASDRGSFGVELYVAEPGSVSADDFVPQANLPSPGVDEIRLRGSATLSVSNEEHYQGALLAATNGADLSTYSHSVLVDLVEVPANPHAKKDSGPVVEVRVGQATVGHLTPAMSARLVRMVARSRDEQKRLTCCGQIFRGSKAGAPVLEIRLSACPHAHDESYVIDPYFEVVTDLVRSRRPSTVHRIRERTADGSYRSLCGVTIKAEDAQLFATTKPWVGDVDPETRAIVPLLDRCERC